jgi:glycerate kinase
VPRSTLVARRSCSRWAAAPPPTPASACCKPWERGCSTAAEPELPRGGAALRELAELDLSGLDPRLRECTFTLASDVDNPLLGPTGAAAVFAPQKGASDDDVAVLEAGLARFAGHVGAAVGRDQSTAAGSGAAGGTGFTALALLRAERRSGIDVVLDPAPFRPNCVVGGQM